MLNVWTTLWRTFGILFIFSISFAAFAQQEQQPGAALSQSQADKIIEKINQLEKNMLKGMHELELKMRDHVDTKFNELDAKIDEKFGELDNKFNKLDKEVAVLRSDVNNLFWILAVIGLPAFLYFVNLIWSKFKLWLNKNKKVSKVPPENREESDEGIGRGNLTDNIPSAPV